MYNMKLLCINIKLYEITLYHLVILCSFALGTVENKKNCTKDLNRIYINLSIMFYLTYTIYHTIKCVTNFIIIFCFNSRVNM